MKILREIIRRLEELDKMVLTDEEVLKETELLLDFIDDYVRSHHWSPEEKEEINSWFEGA